MRRKRTKIINIKKKADGVGGEREAKIEMGGSNRRSMMKKKKREGRETEKLEKTGLLVLPSRCSMSYMVRS